MNSSRCNARQACPLIFILTEGAVSHTFGDDVSTISA